MFVNRRLLVLLLALVAGALVLGSCDGRPTATTPTGGPTSSAKSTAVTVPSKSDRDPFGLSPGNTGDRPGYLVASKSGTTLADVREQVTSQLSAADSDGGGRYAFLPYRLPDGSASLRSVALWEVIERVQEMITSTDVYKALPEPVGGYL